ncbi:MAG TPA: DUF29 domain-containing protein [Oculatellaceae cyanobacterium]|jgi:hypothetical protein
METKIPSSIPTLYEQDYYLWLEKTIQQLRSGQLSTVDLANLIEELESMGRSEKRALMNLLTRLFEHLLKLAYWDSQREYNKNHWKSEIRNFRKQINKELKASPSLKPYLIEIFEECYQDAKEIFSDLSKLPVNTFPVQPMGTVDQILDENWLPLFE